MAVQCALIAGQPALVPAAYPVLEQETFNRINAYRSARGLRPLAWDETVASQCRAHCARMARADRYLAHEGFAERASCIRRVTAFLRVSENVGSNYGYDDPVEAALQGWIESPPHRDAVEGSYAATGIGVDRSASGTYYFAEIFVQR
ncbi:MAG: CAP domain-containing protein [Candidatus Eisenbacteria bacterium]|jgi:uncharacterized protein YkwD|nr:CAP domain-containing protein [Candidatus Eisenbacteria bacterium]